jgi:hypothetical protein
MAAAMMAFLRAAASASLGSAGAVLAAPADGAKIRALAIDTSNLVRQLQDGRLEKASLATPQSWNLLGLPAGIGLVESFALAEGRLAVVGRVPGQSPKLSLVDISGSAPTLLATAHSDAAFPGLYRSALVTASSEAADLSVAEHAQGLLHINGALYVVTNGPNPGLYRLRDTNGDDQYDEEQLLRPIDGGGEHGPHAVIAAPDRKSIYVIGGNLQL